MRRRILASLLLPALAALGVVVPAASASAATINCTAQTQYPHASYHVKGTTNVVVYISCDGPVDTISSTINLYRDGQRVSSNYKVSNGPGIISQSNNTAEPCQSQHTYSADTGWTVWFPAYYHGQRITPPSQTLVTPRTPDRVVTCYAMAGGSQLDSGRLLTSRSNGWRLVMQGDGNLVVYGGSATWSTCTEHWPGSVAQMQGDGNFVIYGPGHIARWSTGTHVPGSRIEMQADGNLVVYTPGGVPLWASASHRC